MKPQPVAADRPGPREIRVAANIYQTPHGWRVYVRREGVLKPFRFKPTVALEDLLHFRDAFKLESKRLRRLRARASVEKQDAPSTFADDVATYLALNVVRAMPSFDTREFEINKWVPLLGTRARSTVTTRELDEHLQGFLAEGYSGSSVNKLRTALMSLWTKLDGRSAANPVKDTQMFDEAPLVARGQAYELLTRILDSIPDERGRGVKGEKGSRKQGSESRARLELLAWTGMDPSQVARMQDEHISLRQRWYISPPRQKGSRRRRTPRPVIKKPMSKEAVRAFRRFVDRGLVGKSFSTHSLRHTWYCAIRRVERELREEYDDPTFALPHIRLKDIRHSFGTRLYEQTENLGIVGQMLDHAPGSPMTLRYALGAVPSVLRGHMSKFKGRGRKRRAKVAAKAQVLPTTVTRARTHK